jgi:hypothetical protein
VTGIAAASHDIQELAHANAPYSGGAGSITDRTAKSRRIEFEDDVETVNGGPLSKTLRNRALTIVQGERLKMDTGSVPANFTVGSGKRARVVRPIKRGFVTRGAFKGREVNVQTGRLLSSKKHLRDTITTLEPVAEGSKIVGGVVVKAHYAAAIELGFEHVGGTHVEGQPYMRPAMQRVKPEYISGGYFKR